MDIAQRDRPRQNCDDFHLSAQLEVKVQEHDQGNAHPDVKNEVHATTDARPLRDACRVIGRPDEIEATCRREDR